MMKFTRAIAILTLALLGGAILAAQAQEATAKRHQAVLDLKPVGYWPADEGEGTVLHDLSTNANHGTIHHIPWRDGMLDFTTAFQWCEVPPAEVWRSDAFTIGGWLFTRDRNYRRFGMLFMALANPTRTRNNPSLTLRVRDGMELEVVSGGKDDALGSLADKDVIAANDWQHVLYTWKNGAAKLFLNGELVQSAQNVPFKLGRHPLIIGSDADWWMLAPPGSSSLNGSVRDLVLFNRVLSESEIRRLQTESRPEKRPWTVTGQTFAIDRDGEYNDQLSLADFFDAPVQARYAALNRMIWLRKRGKLENTDLLFSTLVKSLEQWQLRSLAAELLLSFRPQGVEVIKEYAPLWTETVANTAANNEERATAALALGGMKAQAEPAVPVLIETLQGIEDREGAHLPRVEEFLRNALIRALLDIDSRNEQVRAVLGQALAKPILDAVDLSPPYLEKVRALVAEGRYADAFFTFASLQPLRKYGERYFSQGDVKRDARGGTGTMRAYTPTATRDGVTYTLGAGKSFGAVESIAPEEFKKRVDTIAKEYPEARGWRDPDFPHLYRVKISKTMPDGTRETSYLAGEGFIFDGSDGKVRGWSIAIDTAGYLHIVGGQHNRPQPHHYIPGSWEKLGLSLDRKSESFPNQMYFVSKRPGDITEFEFVGGRNNPRNIPAGYLNYMNWVQDNAGEMFLYGRVNAAGRQSWGLFHYDVETRRWSTIGGQPCDVVNNALEHNPGWREYLHHIVRGGTPTEPGNKTPVVWAWQPHFYNYCRHKWGIKFDKTNRMHLRMGIRGLDENGRIKDAQVYAWSDDLGKTFHRADGSPVKLPLTVNPAPKHNADANISQAYWELWHSLIQRAGL